METNELKKRLKDEAIENYKKAYKDSDIDGCVKALLSLILIYTNESFENDHEYRNVSIKRLLFITNCVKNPLSYKFDENDYKKTLKIFRAVTKILSLLPSEKKYEGSISEEKVYIDNRIIKDLDDIIFYTYILYNMSENNMGRIDASPIIKLPIAEQMMMIILFLQDQSRILQKNILRLLKDDVFTGMEAIVADQPVAYYDGYTSSIVDSQEADLESIDELTRFLYQKYKGEFLDRYESSDFDFSLISPYENVEFERLRYISIQSHMLNRIEEGFRYGYLKLGSKIDLKDSEDIHAKGTNINADNDKVLNGFTLDIDNEDRYKAHIFGIFRRQKQVRTTAAIDVESLKKAERSMEYISSFATALVKNQNTGFRTIDLSSFHPDKEEFLKGEEIMAIKLQLVRLFTKDYFLNADVKGIKVQELITTYLYLGTLAEVIRSASENVIDENDKTTLTRELAIVDIVYLEKELSRIHDFKYDLSQKLIMSFIFSESNNKGQDIFSNPLLKISKSQILFSQALVDQVNLDRVIEKFLINTKTTRTMGKIYEKQVIDALNSGYSLSGFDIVRKPIPGFQVNTNEIKYEAFDGKEIEFDILATFKNCLVLIELKSMLTSYDLDDLETRRKHIADAKQQLLRRRESVQHDWNKICLKSSINLPEKPYDYEHIIMIACTDAYDYTPLYEDEIYITDDSTLLKYFTNPYVECYMGIPGEGMEKKTLSYLWKGNSPRINEFKSYLKNPITTKMYEDAITKEYIPIYCMDEKDIMLLHQEFRLSEDPVKKAMNI